MKVLLVNTYDTGGAAKACIRLHLGLLNIGIDSNLLFLFRRSTEVIPRSEAFVNSAVLKNIVFHIKIKIKSINKNYKGYNYLYRNKFLDKRNEKFGLFNFPFSPYLINEHPLFKKADIVNLHWASEFLDYSSFFKSKKKVIWTLHDMNPFSGGCHHSNECKRFQNNCSECPQLLGTSDPNFSRFILNLKYKSLKNKNIEIVSPSEWLLKESKSSYVFKEFIHHHIPNGVDPKIFKFKDKMISKKKLNIPINKKVILFVSDSLENKKKGFEYLIDALKKLKKFNNDIILCTIGYAGNKNIEGNHVINFGKISSENLISDIYSASDVFIIPSLEENLPNTVIESLLCGIPVIGFPIGGIKELIEDGENGKLCKAISSDSLSYELNKFLSNNYIYDNERISLDAKKKFDINITSKKYLEIFENM